MATPASSNGSQAESGTGSMAEGEFLMPTVIVFDIQSVFSNLYNLVYLLLHDDCYRAADCLCLANTQMIHVNDPNAKVQNTLIRVQDLLKGKGFEADWDASTVRPDLAVVKIFSLLGYTTFRTDKSIAQLRHRRQRRPFGYSGGVTWLIKNRAFARMAFVSDCSIAYHARPDCMTGTEDPMENIGCTSKLWSSPVSSDHMEITCIRCELLQREKLNSLYLVGLCICWNKKGYDQRVIELKLRDLFRKLKLGSDDHLLVVGDFGGIALDQLIVGREIHSYISEDFITFTSQKGEWSPSKCCSDVKEAFIHPLRLERHTIGKENSFPVLLQPRKAGDGDKATTEWLETLERMNKDVDEFYRHADMQLTSGEESRNRVLEKLCLDTNYLAKQIKKGDMMVGSGGMVTVEEMRQDTNQLLTKLTNIRKRWSWPNWLDFMWDMKLYQLDRTQALEAEERSRCKSTLGNTECSSSADMAGSITNQDRMMCRSILSELNTMKTQWNLDLKCLEEIHSLIQNKDVKEYLDPLIENRKDTLETIKVALNHLKRAEVESFDYREQTGASEDGFSDSLIG